MNRIALVVLIATTLLAVPASAETVLITGANRGIGLEFARQYAAGGWTVIATARDPAGAADLNALATDDSDVKVETLDVTDVGQIAALAAKYHGTPIDVLINNAGVYGDRERQTFGQLDEDLLRDMISVNVYGPLKMAEAFADHVAASGEKKIVVISSIVGSIASVSAAPRSTYYAVSKAAVNMAFKGLSETLRPRGIAVGILHPGGVDTRMLREAVGMTQEEAEQSLAEGKPMPGNFKALTPQDSVSQLRARIAELDLATSGAFVGFDGERIPW